MIISIMDAKLHIILRNREELQKFLYLCHMIQNYDVIVIGGGHAGCEAATAAAGMGAGMKYQPAMT